MNVFCLHFSAISFLLPWQWSSNKELIFGRQLKGWPPDPIAHCGCGRRWSSSTENRCGVPHNHPRPISEAQMCHQCVIEHTSLLEATEPSPPARPIRMRGRRVAFLPILWNGAENGKQGHAPHCLSVLNLRSWPPVKLHWDALIYLSVNRKGGEERGGVVSEPATNLPSLLRCIIQYFSHNSLSFEGLSSPSHVASSLLIWKKLRTHSVVPSGFLGVHTLSHTCMIYSACSSMAWDSDLSGQVGKHYFFFLSLAEEVCRLHRGLPEWHWSSLTSHWWLVLLLILRGLLLSQCAATLPWPQ